MRIMTQDASSHVFSVMDQSPSGVVHSVFNNSFNLIFGDRLIHIGASENGLSPFGISVSGSLATLLTASVRNEKEAHWKSDKQEISIGNKITVDVSIAEIHDMALADDEPDADLLYKRSVICAEHLSANGFRAGLINSDEEQTSLLNYLLHGRSPQTEFESRIVSLEMLAQGNFSDAPKAVYDYWIGRGPGLTPSGDDMMTGLLASMEMQGILSLDLRATLKEYLEQQGLKRTTPVACEYLLYALRGFFHASIRNLCMAFSNGDGQQFSSALEEMEKIGHTSGIDTIIGMLIGIKAGKQFV